MFRFQQSGHEGCGVEWVSNRHACNEHVCGNSSALQVPALAPIPITCVGFKTRCHIKQSCSSISFLDDPSAKWRPQRCCESRQWVHENPLCFQGEPPPKPGQSAFPLYFPARAPPPYSETEGMQKESKPNRPRTHPEQLCHSRSSPVSPRTCKDTAVMGGEAGFGPQTLVHYLSPHVCSPKFPNMTRTSKPSLTEQCNPATHCMPTPVQHKTWMYLTSNPVQSQPRTHHTASLALCLAETHLLDSYLGLHCTFHLAQKSPGIHWWARHCKATQENNVQSIQGNVDQDCTVQ